MAIYKNYFDLLKIGNNRKESAPKNMINTVWADHIIQPKARLGSSAILNKVNAKTIASGYEPTPPLVAAMLNPAAINPIKMAAKGMATNSGKAKVVT